MPMSHFFMLGLSYKDGRYGAWNANDLNFSLSFNTKEEKIEANKKVIKQRFENFGPLGYANFILNKARWITLMFLISISTLNFILNKKNNFYDFSFSIIIFGIILFILLFEGRSRYLILYLPFFTMYASNGLNTIIKKLHDNKRLL